MRLLERLLPSVSSVPAASAAAPHDALHDLVREAQRQNRAAWDAINARRARRGEAPLVPETAWEDLLEPQPRGEGQ